MEQLIDCQCGQQYPLEREHCPYCGEAPPYTWVLDDDGNIKPFLIKETEEGTDIYEDGKLRDENTPLPKSLEHLNKKTSIMGKIGQLWRRILWGFFKGTCRVPKKWDAWLDDEDVKDGFTLGKEFREDKVEKVYKG